MQRIALLSAEQSELACQSAPIKQNLSVRESLRSKNSQAHDDAYARVTPRQIYEHGIRSWQPSHHQNYSHCTKAREG